MIDCAIDAIAGPCYAEFLWADWAYNRTYVCMNFEYFTDVS